MTVAQDPFDRTIWRVRADPPLQDDPLLRADPLVRGNPEGPLQGRTAAVKDLYAVAGHPVGAGVADWLAEQRPADHNAAVVDTLLAAGADIIGITQTDQFAFSMAGQNADYGTPPNAAAPGRVPGGSSSGSATAVALGEVDLALGTDTGGSVRVPASYQGIFGIRTTHHLVDRAGLLDLAPSFDTVGWFTRDARLLHDIGELLVPRDRRRPLEPARLLVAPALQDSAEPAIARTTDRVAELTADILELPLEQWHLCTEQLDEWVGAFRTVQSYEAWQIRGDWITAHPGALGPEVEARFLAGRDATAEGVVRARDVVGQARRELQELIKDAVLVQPAASSVPPPIDQPAMIEQVRAFTQRQTCVAGLGGLPSVSVPGLGTGPLPYNICLVGAAGTDLDLIELAGRVSAA